MKTILATLGLLAVVACVPPRSAHDLSLASAGGGNTVRIDEGRAYGPNIEVDRYEDGYRGVWHGRTIDLRVHDDRVLGTLGTMPIDLHVKDENGTLAVQGMVGGRLGNLELTDQNVTGQFAGCGYELHKEDEGYRGFRCGAVDTTLRLPVGWSELPAHERATFLALILTS